MKKTKYFLSALLIMSLLALTACGSNVSTNDTESETETESVQESETEVTPQEIDVTDLDPVAEAGIITGVEDLKIAEGTKVDLNELVFVDDTIVTNVDIDDSKIDYNKSGTYEVIYTITFDGEALRDYLKENKLTVSFDTTGDTIIVKTVVTIEVLTEEETGTALESDKTEVITNETKADIQNNNKSAAVSTAKPSTSNNSSGSSSNSNKPSSSGSETSASSSGNLSSGNNNSSGNNSGNSSNGSNSNSGSSSGNNSTPVHTHTWVAQTKTVHHDEVGHYETVTITAAYDETIYEAHYICNQCGYDAGTTAEAMGVHLFSGDCENYSTKRVAVGTVHHDAVTEQRWVVDQAAYDETVTTGYKCSGCGATK